MTIFENAPLAGKGEFDTTDTSNIIQDQSDSQADSKPLFCSGYGQFHTNEPGKNNPKPYVQISLKEIRQLVEQPLRVDKSEAQWLIASTLPSRTFKDQEENGEFWLLWVDIDHNHKGIHEIARIVESLISYCDYEIYTSKSATHCNQKCRVLIPLGNPLLGGEWVICQEILNDKLQEKDITPDRASERAAQLCYLPNRGEFYDSKCKRDGKSFDPKLEWAEEIRNKREVIKRKAEELEKRNEEAKSKREAFKSYSDTQPYPNLIDAFKACYTVHDILLQAGYAQKGNTFRHPNSESGSFSASVKDDRVHSLSRNDPLYTNGDSVGAHDAFSAFTILFNGGNHNAALKEAGDNWVMIGSEYWNKVRQRDYAQQKEKASFESNFNHYDENHQPEKDNDENLILDYPPGLVGEIAEYIYQSSRMPVKSFAIAGALTTLSYLNNNNAYVGLSDTPLNLYQCLIGDTARGKEDPRKAIKRLIDSVSNELFMESIHESIASGAALLRSLEENPSTLILIDEFGIYLQNALSDRGLIHQKDFNKDLMTMYGLGRSYFSGKVYANRSQNIKRIDKPYINLIGTTTPLELLDGITSKMIDNGLLNRMIFIQADEENPPNRKPNIEIGENLKLKMERIRAIEYLPIEYKDGAHDLLIELIENNKSKDQFSNLWGRVEEQTIRVAGLIAIGDNFVIEQEHVKWSWNYVNGLINDFARKLDKDLAENPFQKLTARALDYIKNVKNYSNDRQFGKLCTRGLMPRGKLTKLLKTKSKDVDDILTYLIETRQITHCEVGGVKYFSVL